jgi:hypothetical protein
MKKPASSQSSSPPLLSKKQVSESKRQKPSLMYRLGDLAEDLYALGRTDEALKQLHSVKGYLSPYFDDALLLELQCSTVADLIRAIRVCGQKADVESLKDETLKEYLHTLQCEGWNPKVGEKYRHLLSK